MNFESRSILDVVPQGCQIIGFDWRYRYINIIAEKHNGRPNAELLGLTVMECWPGITATRVFALEKSCMEERTTHQHDDEFIFSGGHRGWYRLTIQPVEEGIAIFSEDITECKRLEEALRKSERKLSSILDNMSEGLMLFDADGNVVYQNPASLRIHGYKLSAPIEYLALPVTWKGWDERGRTLDFSNWPISRVIRGEHVQDQVLRAQRTDTGHEFFASYNGSPIYDDSEKFAFGFITIHDITERVKGEEALRESEERLRLALNAARMVAWDYDPATLKVTLSENAEEVLELPTRLDNSDKGYNLIHPDDVERHRALVTGAITTGGAYVSVFRHARGEKTIWLEECGSATVDRAGKTVRLVGVVQNISERKRGEEQVHSLLEVIAQERDRLSALVDSITDEVWFADMAGQFRLVNPVARQGFDLKGTGATDMHELAASLEVLLPDGSPRPVEEAPPLRSLRGDLVKNQEELVRVPSTGELRWRQVSASPVRDSSGTIIGSVSVVRDITDHKRAELLSRENEDRRQREFLECVIANAGSCIGVMQGEELRYTMANQAFQAFAPDMPIIGRTYREVFPKAAEEGAEGFLRHVLETGEPWRVEAYHAPVPGMANAIWQGQAVRLPAAPGEEASVLAVAWNITELKLTEDRANNYAQRLIEMEDDLRKSIARDLHDDVAQELTALGLNLAYVSRHLNDDPRNNLGQILEDSRAITMGVTRGVRRLMVELHPLQLEEHGLAVIIRMHAEQFAHRFGIEVTASADPQCPRLSLKKEATIFRITQEAMSNIVKHAAATRVTISLGKVGEFVRLTITDDGKGFVVSEALPQAAGSGWGLTNMQERARLIGGVLSVISNLGQGTTISLEVPEAR